MKHEFKVTKSKEQTVYTLESATGGSTSAGSIASVDSTLGGMQRRNPPGDNILAQEKKEAPKPRNFVAKNAKMGGAGQHKDKKKAEKQGDVKHKNKSLDIAEVAGPEKCWPGHRKVGTKPGTGKNAGKRVNDCEKIKEQGVAEGVAETVPMWDAQKVLNHYGADYFKTTYDTLYFYKFRKQFSLDLIRSDDPADAGSVNLSDLNAMVRKLRDMRKSLPYKEGVAEDHEIQMASSELQSIAKNAVHLLDLVRKYSEQEGLDAWQQSKITKTADYLNSVLQSISGEQSSMKTDSYMESLMNMLERSVSQAQHNLMVGVAHNPAFAQKVKVKQKVGQEFARADQGHDISKLPIRVPKKK